MMFVTISIFLFVTKASSALESSIGSYHCPYWGNEKIHECVKPVQKFAKILDQKEIAQNVTRHKLDKAISIPKIGGQVFQELCSLIRDFNKCVAEVREECPKHIMISLIDASYGYLCNEGYEAFMSSAECLMDLDRKPSVKYCHDETLIDIERANAEVGITLPVKLDRLCEALNYFSGCVRLPIRHNCGVDAWAVIFRVLRDTTSALLPNCQFTGQSRKLFSTTQVTPLKTHKPAILFITSAPKIISNSITEPKQQQLQPLSNAPNYKHDFRTTRTKGGYAVEPVFYSNRKSKTNGEHPTSIKLATKGVASCNYFDSALSFISIIIFAVYFIV